MKKMTILVEMARAVMKVDHNVAGVRMTTTANQEEDAGAALGAAVRNSMPGQAARVIKIRNDAV